MKRTEKPEQGGLEKEINIPGKAAWNLVPSQPGKGVSLSAPPLGNRDNLTAQDTTQRRLCHHPKFSRAVGDLREKSLK